MIRRMKSSRFVSTLALATLAAAAPATAHHSFAAEYDSSKSISVTGEVIRLEWTNPHARVVVSRGAATIEDLRSKNGTFVNGDRIADSSALRDHDEVRLGQVTLSFHIASRDGTTVTNMIS